MNRRDFLKSAASIAAVGAIVPNQRVMIVIDASNPISDSAQSRWAASELERTLADRSISVQVTSNLQKAQPRDVCIFVTGAGSKPALAAIKSLQPALSDKPGSFAMSPSNVSDRKVVLIVAADATGIVYALLELADRARYSNSPVRDVSSTLRFAERPFHKVRSVTRLFSSDVEDKPWFNDREFWTSYLTMLASNRFNRFNLALGLGYDFLKQVTDAYFLFAYPFLLSVPGYNVKADPLPDLERDRNLAMLRFISEETVKRGMEFQLGVWMHGWQWIDSPNANYRITGLNRDNHAQYCRDALRLLLQQCPAISHVTIRTHGESGVEEGNYDFWKTIFDGVGTCGRKVGIDLHPKGLDPTMLQNAIATGQTITVSPKYWAEHLGMPYHQADIRDMEIPKAGETYSGLMKISAGSRSFLRYGYGDLLTEKRNWRVIYKVWPGSQRLLLSGDPLTTAASSRAFAFCGGEGAELFDPLSFKGRRGSGIAGDRCAFADSSLRPHWDFEKYSYTYRIWGRLLYNPDAESESWERYNRYTFGAGAEQIEQSIANASRILPIITTAHLPSAANNNYWPEMYLNHSMFDAEHPGSYSDTPAPKVFGNVSPLDPQLFSRINDSADELLSGEHSAKYSPIEVAQWIDERADLAMAFLSPTALTSAVRKGVGYRRLAADVRIQCGVGHFFARKFRAGVLYRIYEKTGEYAALEACLVQYRSARDEWASFAIPAKEIYSANVTVGELPQLHGHWADRLPAIDNEISVLSEKLKGIKQTQPSRLVAAVISEVIARPQWREAVCKHAQPSGFAKGADLEIRLTTETPGSKAILYYRHVNQAERFNSLSMTADGLTHQGVIPARYTDSQYPMQYYFEIREPQARPVLYPGFLKELANQPYFVIHQV